MREPAESRPELALFDDFQHELEALDTFREQYRHLYPFAGLDRDDPDVLRLLEGLAFFTARTRRQADRALAAYERRALEELFPYLVSPMPSMALVVIDGAERAPEARTIPAGTELTVTARGNAAIAYRTLRSLELRPIHLDRERIALTSRGDAGWELTVPMRSATSRVERLGEIELHLDPHGDLLAAMRLHHALRHHVEDVWCEFPGTRQRPKRCRVSFAPRPDEDEPFTNPLERFRRLLHFPLAALVVRVTIDETPATWERLVLRFALGPSWPTELAVPPAVLVLHAAPVINAHRGLAEPVILDGTRARVQVAFPDPTLGFAPREIVSVSRSTRAGLEPIPPENLADEDGDWYAVDVSGLQQDRQVWLELHAPASFDAAAAVVVEADWYQPAAGRQLVGPLWVAPSARYIEGLRWRVVAPLQDAVDSPLAGHRGRLRRLLAIGGVELDAPGLSFLLDTLGAASHEVLQRVSKAIATVASERSPDARAASGRRTVYRIVLRRLPRVLYPVADLIASALPALLAAWAGTEPPEVRVLIEGAGDVAETTYRAQGGSRDR